MAQQTTFNTKLFEGFQMYNLQNGPHGECNHDILEKAKDEKIRICLQQ